MSEELTTQQETAAPEENMESFADMLASQENAQVRIQAGQKVQGTVIEVTDDSVFVNIGAKIDGIMERKDFVDSEGNRFIEPGDFYIIVKDKKIRITLTE